MIECNIPEDAEIARFLKPSFLKNIKVLTFELSGITSALKDDIEMPCQVIFEPPEAKISATGWMEVNRRTRIRKYKKEWKRVTVEFERIRIKDNFRRAYILPGMSLVVYVNVKEMKGKRRMADMMIEGTKLLGKTSKINVHLKSDRAKIESDRAILLSDYFSPSLKKGTPIYKEE